MLCAAAPGPIDGVRGSVAKILDQDAVPLRERERQSAVARCSGAPAAQRGRPCYRGSLPSGGAAFGKTVSGGAFGQRRQLRPVLLAHQAHGVVGHLPLQVLDVAVLRIRLEASVLGVAQDRGRMNTMRFVLLRSVFRERNSQPKPGMRPKPGTRRSDSRSWSSMRPPSTRISPSLTNTCVVIVRVLVIRSAAPSTPRAQARGLLLDVELDAAAFVDLRRDLQARADLFALDRLKRVHGALVRAGVRELARQERHFLADADFGFLVVERHDVRRRDDVRLAVAAQRVQAAPPSWFRSPRSCRRRS